LNRTELLNKFHLEIDDFKTGGENMAHHGHGA